uniref:Peroxiredoxin-like 2A n=1 Tax=Hucho hucho TaxID=62062 RepID=A0A4W5PYA5_9TELE
MLYMWLCILMNCAHILILQEASELSSLKPQLEELGVSLYAVVKEDIGTEIQNFRPYFNGEIFVDEKQCFYGPKLRRMGLGLGLARLGVWQNLLRARKKGYQGNKKGEGFILGGVYVIGAGKQVSFSFPLLVSSYEFTFCF